MGRCRDSGFARARRADRLQFTGPSQEMRGDRVVPITCSREASGRAWISIGSSGLGGQFRAGYFHRPHIHIKQSVALVTFVLVLLPQLDDFLEDFYIKTLSLGLRKDFFF